MLVNKETIIGVGIHVLLVECSQVAYQRTVWTPTRTVTFPGIPAEGSVSLVRFYSSTRPGPLSPHAPGT